MAQVEVKHGLRKARRVGLLGIVLLIAGAISYSAKAAAVGAVFLVLAVLSVLAACVVAYSVRMRAIRQLEASVQERQQTNMEEALRKLPRSDS
jgi:Zn-dependent membrane protease YugP